MHHRNSDGLDNTDKNTRVGCYMMNNQNMLMRKDNTSGSQGVTSRNGKYAAKIQVNGHGKHLGTYKTPEEAAAVYEAARRKYHIYAELNDLDSSVATQNIVSPRFKRKKAIRSAI